MTPPAYLYHGTVAHSLDAIRAEGLRPMNRRDVHLSPDRDTATRVGARRGRPVVLSVDAGAMHRDGDVFHVSANGMADAGRTTALFALSRGPLTSADRTAPHRTAPHREWTVPSSGLPLPRDRTHKEYSPTLGLGPWPDARAR